MYYLKKLNLYFFYGKRKNNTLKLSVYHYEILLETDHLCMMSKEEHSCKQFLSSKTGETSMVKYDNYHHN